MDMNFNDIAFRMYSIGSGGAPIKGEHISTIMKVRDLLKKEIAYIKDVEEIDSDPEHEDRKWEVYLNVKKIQDSLANKTSFKDLPAIQIVENKVIDGAHRLNAINLISKKRPEVLNYSISVEIYSPDIYEKEIKRLNKVM